jgi:fatty acid desaturase
VFERTSFHECFLLEKSMNRFAPMVLCVMIGTAFAGQEVVPPTVNISKAAPWLIYGAFMILFMYVMPTGVAGALRLAWTRFKRSGQDNTAA